LLASPLIPKGGGAVKRDGIMKKKRGGRREKLSLSPDRREEGKNEGGKGLSS